MSDASKPVPPPPPERRRNPELRDLLDELIGLVRHLSNRVEALPSHEVEYARQRLEWLADEIWANLTRDIKGQSGGSAE